MSYTNVRIHKDLMQQVEARKTGWQTTTAIINDLLASALDSTLTLGARPAGAGSLLLAVNKEEEERARAELVNVPPTPAPKPPKDPWTLKTVSPALVPEELDSVAELFCEWWANRPKGSGRSESVAKREFKKLLDWKPEERTKALQDAVAGGWKMLYEPKTNTPAQGRYSASEPDLKHPAYRDAGDVIAESKRLAQQNVEHLRRKKQEEEEAKAGNGVLAGFDLKRLQDLSSVMQTLRRGIEAGHWTLEDLDKPTKGWLEATDTSYSSLSLKAKQEGTVYNENFGESFKAPVYRNLLRDGAPVVEKVQVISDKDLPPMPHGVTPAEPDGPLTLEEFPL